MRRLVDYWWVAGSGLVLAVVVLTFGLYLGESGRQHQQQRGVQRQVVTDLNQPVDGEEFAWLMPETDELGAYTAADRVRQALENAAFGESGKVTLSAGVCSSENAPDADALSRDADRALYSAKEDGRNLTVRCGEAPPTAVSR